MIEPQPLAMSLGLLAGLGKVFLVPLVDRRFPGGVHPPCIQESVGTGRHVICRS